MTELEFEKYFDTPAGQADFFDYLYNNHYGLIGEDAIINAMESGNYYDSFMESMVTK